MTDFEIEEDGVDCVDEEFDEASREWEDDEDTGNDVIPELYFYDFVGFIPLDELMKQETA